MTTIEMRRKLITDIARACDVTHSAVSQWFSGSTKPSLKNIFIVEEQFGIPAKAWLDIKAYLNHTPQPAATSSAAGAENPPEETA